MYFNNRFEFESIYEDTSVKKTIPNYRSDAADAYDLVEGASGEHWKHGEGEQRGRRRVQPPDSADSDVDGGVFKLDNGGGVVVREVGSRSDEHGAAGSQRRTEQQVLIRYYLEQ